MTATSAGDAPARPHPGLQPAAPTPSHGATAHADGTTTFALWAPAAEQVELVLEGARHPMPPADGPAGDAGWRLLRAEAGHGARYAYALDGDDPLPDPAARWLPDGVHAPAAVVDPSTFRWTDAAFQAAPVTGAVIYELHVGTFTTEGTFAAAAEHLADLADLGVTHVEVMPVNAFDGAHGWGYDGVQWWAVHQPYGGPEGFARFVDACHGNGLAVVLDVVHNHLGPSGAYMPRFGPYLQSTAESTWGKVVNLDGPGSAAVRAMAIGSALMWLRDLHVDALRLDAVHALDDRGSARHVLAELADAVADLSEQTGRRLELIAETDRNDPAWLQPRAAGGFGLDAQWADDLHHAIHVAVTGEVDGYYADYADPVDALARAYERGLVYDGSLHSPFRGRVVGGPVPPTVSSRRLVACAQNHDQVGNRAAGDRLTTLVEPDLVRTAAVLLLAAPHTPMLFMGEEHGETNPFQFFSDMPGDDLRQAIRDGRRAEFAHFTSWQGEVPDPLDPATFRRSTLDRSAATTEAGRQRRALLRDLIALRRSQPALGTGRRDLVHTDRPDDRVLVVTRRAPEGAGAGAAAVRLVANLADEAHPLPLDPGSTLLLSTADAAYGGPGHAPGDPLPPRSAALIALPSGGTR